MFTVRVIPYLSAAAIALSAAGGAQGALFQGVVVGIADGNTVRIKAANETFTARLIGLDAPDLDQEFGHESLNALTRLTFNKQVMVKLIEAEGQDDRGRYFAQLATNSGDVGLYMLEHGFAWSYTRNASSMGDDWDYAYTQAEYSAKGRREGLWKSDRPVPPWTWRKSKRDKAAADNLDKQAAPDLSMVNKEVSEKVSNLKTALQGEEVVAPDIADKDKVQQKKRSWWTVSADLGLALCRWIVTAIKSIF